ncbi:alpha/beta-hydrolase [Aureobasidium pullulans]|uniref:Alpha/beta-hydrolase n=1 Tax=Aureobasidium pullulans TaxID=5580 RepID=A0A4S8S4X2_AURPU|nr:alpha/beta-hydrolase [Aureobasidium pullulans]THZ77856.1 alpha/beta-hydrolase [Aureobasidium pullulans]
MTITTRSGKSTPIALLQTIIKPFRPRLIKPNKELPPESPKLDIHRTAKKRCNVIERQVEGIWLYEMTPNTASLSSKSTEIERKRHIYYFAGGGWQMPPSPEHWKLCAELCHRLANTTVTIVSYPLAPNSPAKDSIPALERLYPYLFPTSEADKASTEIVFAGDSAGGNVVLGLMVKVLASTPSAPVPQKLVLVSPAVDLRPQPVASSPFEKDLVAADKLDPLLGIPFTNGTAENWSRGADAEAPYISPVLADVGVFEERGIAIYGVTAGADVLAPPAKHFADRCREAGVDGKWLHWEGLMHCFVLAWCYGIKEGKEGLEWLIGVMEE